jgi:hypothetical protein
MDDVDADEEAMAGMMGFGGFGTTKASERCPSVSQEKSNRR